MCLHGIPNGRLQTLQTYKFRGRSCHYENKRKSWVHDGKRWGSYYLVTYLDDLKPKTEKVCPSEFKTKALKRVAGYDQPAVDAMNDLLKKVQPID